MSERRHSAPGRLGDAARRWLEAGSPATVPARRAATVMLLRTVDTNPEVQVFMLRRVASMAFAPSMWVFPGGGVDARDAETELPWAGPSPQQWATRMGVPETEAIELVCAAVREVFEECGVLLAGAPNEPVLRDVTGEHWSSTRTALLSRELSMAQVLARDGLVLRSDLLSLQDHWITPEFEPKRYDTFFFAALLPVGQRADDLTTEADRCEWVQPSALLQSHTEGTARMLPPTVTNLERLVGAVSPEAVVAAMPKVVPIMPVPTIEDGQVVLWTSTPGDVGGIR